MKNFKRALKTFFIFLLLSAPLTISAGAQGNTAEEYYSEQYRISRAEDLKDALPQDTKDYMESIGIDEADFYSIFEASPKKLFELLMNIASGKIGEPLKGMLKILGIILLAAAARSLFPPDGRLETALNISVGAAVVISAAAPLSDAISRGVSAITVSSDFMLVLVPVMAGVITAGGNPTLALSYNSLTFAAAQAVSQLSKNVVLPLSGMFMAAGIISGLAPELKLNSLSDVIKKTALGTLSFSAAMFSAVLSLKGIMACSADSLLSKGIKLAVSSAVPVVGGAISEAYSSIVGSLALLKNAVGMFGITAVAVINLPVMLELLFWTICFKLSAVFSAVLGDDKSSEMLGVISSALTVINVMVLFCALIFIISTGIILSLRMSV